MKKYSIIFMGLAIITVLAWVVYTSLSQQNDQNLAINKGVSTPTPTSTTSLRGFDTQATPGTPSVQDNAPQTGEVTKGGILLANSPTPSTKPTEAVKSYTTQVVRLTDNGFVPNSIVGKLGTTILFINETNSLMQIVEESNSSRILSGFSMTQGIGKNGSFEYILRNLGKTGFINNYKPTQKGTLEITQ